MGQNAVITGWGYYVPSKVVTNFDLEKIVDTSDEWITTRTGIKERRYAAEGETSAATCPPAWPTNERPAATGTRCGWTSRRRSA